VFQRTVIFNNENKIIFVDVIYLFFEQKKELPKSSFVDNPEKFVYNFF
jgi:hypothetical protein